MVDKTTKDDTITTSTSTTTTNVRYLCAVARENLVRAVDETAKVQPQNYTISSN